MLRSVEDDAKRLSCIVFTISGEIELYHITTNTLNIKGMQHSPERRKENSNPVESDSMWGGAKLSINQASLNITIAVNTIMGW